MKKCKSCKNELIDTAKFCPFCGSDQPNTLKDIDYELEFLKKTLEPSFSNIEILGKGGMATLYLASQNSLARKVVVKMLLPQLALNEKLSEDFLKEARIAANLKHPNIVEMVDYGKSENRPYYIMEYGEKGSLDNFLKKGNKLSIENSCKIMLDILNALKFASEKNLKVHRDIKPGNIIMRESGSVFITDFGVALLNDQYPETNETIGTAEYMSPEQCQGDIDIDLRSDIYSCGILFFELITGLPPFKSKDPSIVMNLQRENKLPELESKLDNEKIKAFKNENISLESISNLILKATQKDKTLRYSSYSEIINDLKDAIGDFDRRIIGSISKQKKISLSYAILASFFIIATIFFLGQYYYYRTCKNCCYDGDCINGVGKYSYNSGKRYHGKFKNGIPSDEKGSMIYENGNSYEGEFKDGKINGFGTFIDRIKNESYKGQFKDGTPHGDGSYTFKDGSVYDGKFNNGEPKGKGTFITKEKDIYRGEFPEGDGILLYSNGDRYEGHFKNGMRHGKGTHTKKNGTIYKGIWEYDKFISPKGHE